MITRPVTFCSAELRPATLRPTRFVGRHFVWRYFLQYTFLFAKICPVNTSSRDTSTGDTSFVGTFFPDAVLSVRYFFTVFFRTNIQLPIIGVQLDAKFRFVMNKSLIEEQTEKNSYV